MQLVHAKLSFSTLSRRHPAQYICTGWAGANMGDVLFESIALGGMMLNCDPESVELLCWCESEEDSEESTEVYCCRSRLASAVGGVSALLRGEAWNDWN